MAANKPHKKVKRTTNRRFSLKKAITKIRLGRANEGKIAKLELLAAEYMRVTQVYCDLLIADGQLLGAKRQYAVQPKAVEQGEAAEAQPKEEAGGYVPDKNVDLPEEKTGLSVRWQRCAWRQACGIVQSWFSNERTNPPVLRGISLQADVNVAELQKSADSSFDYWIKLATLERNHPVLLPVKLYKKAHETLAKYPCLFSGLRIEKTDGQWYLTLVVGKENRKAEAGEVVGVDLGLKSMLVSTQGVHFGQISEKLRQRVERSKERFARKQKLNGCLKKKGKPTVNCGDQRVERFVRNEAGRAINAFLHSLPPGTSVALERLNVKDMRFKSREMNRWLRAAQLGFLSDRLKFKLDDAGIRYRSVQAAYSSQQCAQCGFVHKANRPSQERFHCLHCGFTAHADFNASLVIAKRFGDEELNRCAFKSVKTLLDARFTIKYPDARSASAGLEPRGNPVNQPSQPNVYIGL